MLDSIAQAITGFLRRNNSPLGLLVLAAAALLEYVFPPFPGDTVTLFSAVLVARFDWNLWLVFGSVMAGAAAGSMIDYYVGVWMGDRYVRGRLVRRPAVRERINAVLNSFRRHGEAYVMLNRFLPAVRAVFFLAAGMARLRPLRVLFFSMISAAAWNTLILAVGYAVGASWDRIRWLFATYSRIAWGVIGLGLVLLMLRWLWRRRRRGEQRAEKPAGDDPPGPAV